MRLLGATCRIVDERKGEDEVQLLGAETMRLPKPRTGVGRLKNLDHIWFRRVDREDGGGEEAQI